MIRFRRIIDRHRRVVHAVDDKIDRPRDRPAVAVRDCESDGVRGLITLGEVVQIAGDLVGQAAVRSDRQLGAGREINRESRPVHIDAVNRRD